MQHRIAITPPSITEDVLRRIERIKEAGRGFEDARRQREQQGGR
ncbi:hypothetical protein RCO28_34475 [Streptomyces sp. LHD-70]|nr:hypothetical protein [Streptomyces sp. LHD-70]MDQ8707539.1 hypothetical protein [Streptomyces sp. LHD-70]